MEKRVGSGNGPGRKWGQMPSDYVSERPQAQLAGNPDTKQADRLHRLASPTVESPERSGFSRKRQFRRRPQPDIETSEKLESIALIDPGRFVGLIRTIGPDSDEQKWPKSDLINQAGQKIQIRDELSDYLRIFNTCKIEQRNDLAQKQNR